MIVFHKAIGLCKCKSHVACFGYIVLYQENRENIPTSRTGTIDGLLCMIVLHKAISLCKCKSHGVLC